MESRSHLIAESIVLKGDIERLQGRVKILTDECDRLNEFLRQKDEAMGVLFDRLAKAGVDCSDLIP